MNKVQQLLDEILQFKLPTPEVKEIPMESLMPLERNQFPAFADTVPMAYAQQVVQNI